MKLNSLPEDIRKYIVPKARGEMTYQCIECQEEFPIFDFLYTCPKCHNLLKIVDKNFTELGKISGGLWRKIFDYRRALNLPALKGIFLFHELIFPIIPLRYIVYLGEGHTPLVRASKEMEKIIGRRFFVKNDGQNPSLSFKDRGMASALSFINYLTEKFKGEEIISICASTGDTSASAALYSSYLRGKIKSAVLLPQGKVTSQQLAQPLGSGATVLEMPGVFDDCMKIVEAVSEKYNVVLLNSKNPIRIQGQTSFAFEVCQQMDWKTRNLTVVIPIGNAGNMTAILEGFLKLYELGIIKYLPQVVGIQSEHADPVVRYFEKRGPFNSIKVKPSVAQAAMIGDPVSMPKIIKLVDAYRQGRDKHLFWAIRVSEQEIMDMMLLANRHGHVICTQGGESLAGLKRAVEMDIVRPERKVVVDSTAHQLKFVGFQNRYFENDFPPDYQIQPKPELQNKPRQIEGTAQAVARALDLKEK